MNPTTQLKMITSEIGSNMQERLCKVFNKKKVTLQECGVPDYWSNRTLLQQSPQAARHSSTTYHFRNMDFDLIKTFWGNH